MRVGVSLRSAYSVGDARTGARWMIERAAAARAARLDSLFVGDHHVIGAPFYQNTPMLGRLLAEWGDAPAGALYSLPLWNPVLLAEHIGTLASIADGRFIVQCGLGDGRRQFAAMAADIRQRVSTFERALATIRTLLAGGEVGGARVAPVPSEPVPRGAAGRRVPRRAVPQPRPGPGADRPLPRALRRARATGGCHRDPARCPHRRRRRRRRAPGSAPPPRPVRRPARASGGKPRYPAVKVWIGGSADPAIGPTKSARPATTCAIGRCGGSAGTTAGGRPSVSPAPGTSARRAPRPMTTSCAATSPPMPRTTCGSRTSSATRRSRTLRW